MLCFFYRNNANYIDFSNPYYYFFLILFDVFIRKTYRDCYWQNDQIYPVEY